MAQREEAMVNKLRDALIREVEKIGNGGEAEWLTTPATVGRLSRASAVHVEFPAIFVSASRVREREKLAAGLHNGEAEFTFWLAAKNNDDPDGEMHRLAADLAKCLTEAEATLESFATSGLDFVEYTFDSEASERLGATVGRSVWKLAFKWSHANP